MQFLITLAAFVLAVTAQDPSSGFFITPPAGGAIHDYSQNPTYKIGQQITIEWSANWKNVDLLLWQNDNPTPETLLQDKPNNGKLQWQVATNKNYSAKSGTNGTVFFLQLGSAMGPNAFGSHYFNLTGPDPSTSSADPSTTSVAVNNLVAGAPSASTLSTVTRPTSSPTSSPSSSTASSGSPSSASSVSSSASSSAQAASSTNNVGLAVGLGVSLGLVVAGLIAAIAFILVRRKKQSKVEVVQMPGYGPGAGITGAYMQQQAPVEIMSGRRATKEFFNGVNPVHEMSAKSTLSRPGARALSGVHEMSGRRDTMS